MTYPFNKPNFRVFYACQAVFVEERNSEEGNSGNPTNADFLTCVQSVGVSSDNPSTSLMDIGRFQRKNTIYQQQNIEITINRRLDRGSDTFYKVASTQYTNYTESHILHANNFGSCGTKDNNGKTLRNFDITILYTPDRFSRINNANSNVHQYSNSSQDADADNVISVSYLNCLITNISYDIGVDGVSETITLTTRNLKYNNDYTTLSDYNLPTEWTSTYNRRLKKLIFQDGTTEIVEWGHASSVERHKYHYDNPVVDEEEVENAAVPSIYAYQSGITIKRKDFDLTRPDHGNSKLPEEIKRLFDLGDTIEDNGVQTKILGIQSISFNVSFDYRELTDVGTWRGSENTKEHEQNRWKILNLPISVSCTFTGKARQHMPYSDFLDSGENRVRNVDNIYTAERGVSSSPYDDWTRAEEEIKIVARGIGPPEMSPQEYFVWDLGKKNYLTSIEYNGGDAGGGDVEASITYSNQYSDFVVTKTQNILDLTNNGPY